MLQQHRKNRKLFFLQDNRHIISANCFPKVFVSLAYSPCFSAAPIAPHKYKKERSLFPYLVWQALVNRNQGIEEKQSTPKGAERFSAYHTLICKMYQISPNRYGRQKNDLSICTLPKQRGKDMKLFTLQDKRTYFFCRLL